MRRIQQTKRKVSVLKRVEVGKAWIKHGDKVKRFTSGFITPEGLALMMRLYKYTRKQVNFYVLPNPKRTSTPDQPQFLVFVPYTAYKLIKK